MTYTPAQSRRLDAWIAENVMGWAQHPDMEDCWATGPKCNGLAPYRQKHYFCPTTDLLAAFEVKDEIIAGRHVCFQLTEGSHMLPHAEFFDVETGHERFGASAETISLAICIAAIRAKGGDVDLIAGDPA